MSPPFLVAATVGCIVRPMLWRDLSGAWVVVTCLFQGGVFLAVRPPVNEF
ncbi:MAG: hypothetical protein NZ703_14860 [Gemmataceae bacterium]|nr:hypothetical protein [Gemmataceae bacterium]MCS7272361.1 hypothetical protein [Gemmataceae bacterium]MDW8243446.1 hypothetical protein [Thermogemmata sp.]